MNVSPNSSRLAFLLLGASLALGFTVAADKLAKGLVQSRRSPGIVSVKGLASHPVRADIARLSGSFSGKNPVLTEAAASCASTRDKVLKFYASKGVKADEIAFTPVSASPVYERDKEGVSTSRLLHYSVSQAFTITKKDTAAVATLADAVGELIGAGVEVDMHTPAYLVTDLESAKRGLLEEATKNARERAGMLVSSAGGGSELGRLTSISQGVFTVKAANDTSGDSDYNTFDTRSPEKVIRLVVSADFEVIKTQE